MDGAVEALLRHGPLIVFGWVFTVQVGVPIPTVPFPRQHSLATPIEASRA